MRKAAALIPAAEPGVSGNEALSDGSAVSKVVSYLVDKPMDWGLNTDLQALLKGPVSM